MKLEHKIFMDDSKSKTDGAPKPGIPGPIHLVRRGDYLCGLIREYEENRRALMEQNALIAKMPVREGFGFEQPNISVPGSSSKGAAAAQSPSVASSAVPRGGSAKAAAKRRKTPEYTDSEDSEDE